MVPGAHIFVPHADIAVERRVVFRFHGGTLFVVQCAGNIIGQSARIQLLEEGHHFTDIRHRPLAVAVELVAHAPADNARMIAVRGNHLRRLLLCRLFNPFARRLRLAP